MGGWMLLGSCRSSIAGAGELQSRGTNLVIVESGRKLELELELVAS
jgi:hypothetical protein